MKKIICKREYDTETATLIKKHTVGEFGDPAGYEETLYQTPAACTFCTSAVALHLPMPKRISNAWPRARWTHGWNLTERTAMVRMPPEAGMIPPSEAFCLPGFRVLRPGRLM